MKEQTSFMHLVEACRNNKERAELALVLAQAALGFAEAVHQDKTGVPMRMMLACREAVRVIVLATLPHEGPKQ